MKKTRKLLLPLLVTLSLVLLLSGCVDEGTPSNDNIECNHQYGDWVITKNATCTDDGQMVKKCKDCDDEETKAIAALGHTEVIDKAVEPTCTFEGKTEGKHCSVCNQITVAQNTIAAKGHTEQLVAAIPATCTTPGLTEGKICSVCSTITVAQNTIAAKGHTEQLIAAIPATCTTPGLTEGKICSVCSTITVAQNTIAAKGHTSTVIAGTAPTCTATGLTDGERCSICSIVLTPQTSIPATGHDYKYTTTKEATCNEDGVKRVTCSRCTYSSTQTFKLQSYTATEIYNQAVEYTGEIVTYKKDGSSYSLGTCFVISSDGKVLTNYHVIEGAYSAKIYIKGKSYTVTHVLGYDKDIDLAVLKINVSEHPYATICKKSVNVGSTVYAIGSSRGLTDTFSQGIVTSMRTVDGVMHVQHDASITHGNSGGPLINVWGEVIGINTWGLENSQNLNFAVFTTELDNLKNTTKMTMAAFYAKECTPRKQLISYILKNYNTTYTNGSAVSVKYNAQNGKTYYLYYDEEKDMLTLDIKYKTSGGDTVYIYIELFENSNPYYYATYEFSDGETLKMSGYITASTFTSNTLLGYSNYYGNSYYLTDIRKLFSNQVIDLIGWYNYYYTNYGTGVSLADLGFTSFN